MTRYDLEWWVSGRRLGASVLMETEAFVPVGVGWQSSIAVLGPGVMARHLEIAAHDGALLARTCDERARATVGHLEVGREWTELPPVCAITIGGGVLYVRRASPSRASTKQTVRDRGVRLVGGWKRAPLAVRVAALLLPLTGILLFAGDSKGRAPVASSRAAHAAPLVPAPSPSPPNAAAPLAGNADRDPMGERRLATAIFAGDTPLALAIAQSLAAEHPGNADYRPMVRALGAKAQRKSVE